MHIKLPTGEVAEGVAVDVIQANERWNEYLLDDGRILKVKLVLTCVLRLDDRKDENGNPGYVFKSTTVVAVTQK